MDGRNVDLITFSHKNNFSEINEGYIPDLFLDAERCKIAKRPIVFISSRVHPGETPASFVLDGVLQILVSNDPRALALRNAFVFKIVPALNPDGIFRGNFRVDQNGINLNRCYINPDLETQPSIYAVKKYFEFLSPKAKYYFDLHAHASKKSCFLFGNSLDFDKQVENQLLAKLFELNTSYFEYSECDFSEKSMSYRDPKDHHSKEGSGRVALYKATGIINSYTIECSYYIPRPLHMIPTPMTIKTGMRHSENSLNCEHVVKVYNRNFFFEVSSALLYSILDYEKISPISRLPLSEFRFLEAAKEWIKARILAQNRTKKLTSKEPVKIIKKNEKLGFPKIPIRKIHKNNIIPSIYIDSGLTNKQRVLASLAKPISSKYN